MKKLMRKKPVIAAVALLAAIGLFGCAGRQESAGYTGGGDSRP